MTTEPMPAPPAHSAWLAYVPRVFRHRNYRVFYVGQAISLIGTWIQSVALSWLVYRLTHSVVLLGIVSFASQGPIFFITPFAGMIADRNDRRAVFIVTRSLCMAQAALLTVLTFTNAIEINS